MTLKELENRVIEKDPEKIRDREILFCDPNTNTYYPIKEVKVSDGSLILIGN